MSGVRVLGIGSPSGDDQAGWLTVDALLATGVDVDVEKLDRPGAGLIAHLEGAPRVILVDAMRGNGEPGRIQRFDEAGWPGYRHGLSSHGLGVLDALRLAQTLGNLPPRLELYGIEIGSVNPDGVPGERVQAAAWRLAHLIADELGKRPAA